MKITPLFSVALPAITVSLKERIDELLKKSVNVAIYSSNFIPFYLKVKNEGVRELFVANFDANTTKEEASTAIELEPDYEEARIEDVLALVNDPRFDESCPVIVCTGAFFPPDTPSFVGGERTVCVRLSEKFEQRSLGMAPKETSFGVEYSFLLVKKVKK